MCFVIPAKSAGMRSEVCIGRVPRMGGGVFSSHPACFAPHHDSSASHGVFHVTRCALYITHLGRFCLLLSACACGDLYCLRSFSPLPVATMLTFSVRLSLSKVDKQKWLRLKRHLAMACPDKARARASQGWLFNESLIN